MASHQRNMPGGWADPDGLEKGPSGRNLCRWCGLELLPGRRRTFCSEWCVHEWKLRTDPGYLRDQVSARDHGRCAACGLDCDAEWRRLKRLRGASRVTAWAEWKPGRRKSLWEADHIVPVAEGGGECDLGNLRTLCLKCHRAVTAALRERLKAQRETAARGVK